MSTTVTTNRADDPTVDSIVPGEKWVFDENVAACFDQMLERSVPNYGAMRELTFNIGRNFVHNNSMNIIDLGASRGEAIAPFVKLVNGESYNEYLKPRLYALEISEPMRVVMNSRFGFGRDVTVMDYDLRKINNEYAPFNPNRSNLILSILTIQFTPIEHRQKILRCIYKALSPGGAFLFVEKILGDTYELDELMVKEYYAKKAENGYSYEDIQRKRASLEGVLVPMTHSWNVELLRRAGFTHIDTYYRYLNFEGLICIKE